MLMEINLSQLSTKATWNLEETFSISIRACDHRKAPNVQATLLHLMMRTSNMACTTFTRPATWQGQHTLTHTQLQRLLNYVDWLSVPTVQVHDMFTLEGHSALLWARHDALEECKDDANQVGRLEPELLQSLQIRWTPGSTAGCIALNCIALRCIALHCVPLNCNPPEMSEFIYRH